MKRITKIEIENFRAFFGKYKIELPKGENLLVYGENGSGKSSLYKALNYFFDTSLYQDFSFEVNTYATPQDGSVDITFSETDAEALPVEKSEQTFSFKPTTPTNTESFIKDTARIKGFLEYKNLLAVYVNQGGNPNLFNLFINEILAEHIPVGETERIREQWFFLENILQGVDGRLKEHKDAIDKLPAFEAMLITFFKRLFLRFNYLLIKYFKLNMRVGYVLQNITFKGGELRNLNSELRLDIRLNGKQITEHTEYLNEARLSALSVCLFLASVLENPIAIDYKILFLDDVFIGLDSGNRIPIAKILKEEFKDYQIFITTYDRHWYEMAKRFFENTMPYKWKCVEMYLVKDSVGIAIAPAPPVIYNFEKPLLIDVESNFSKAVNHLHSKTTPDYPAAANYFRKYAEEILKPDWLSHETRSAADDSSIQGYRLTKLAVCIKNFLKKIKTDTSLLEQLEQFLPTLLHPLSHHDLASPIYKGELNEIQSCLTKLADFLIEVQSKCKMILPADRMLKLTFELSASNHGYYEIQTNEALYLTDNAGSKTLSDCKCTAKKCYRISGTNRVKGKSFKAEDDANYFSVEDSYEKIYAFIHGQSEFSHVVKSTDYKKEFEYAEEKNWKPFQDLTT